MGGVVVSDEHKGMVKKIGIKLRIKKNSIHVQSPDLRLLCTGEYQELHLHFFSMSATVVSFGTIPVLIQIHMLGINSVAFN